MPLKHYLYSHNKTITSNWGGKIFSARPPLTFV